MNISKNISNDSFWLNDVIGFVGLNYKIELNKYYENQSNLVINFLLKDHSNLYVKFINISSLHLEDIGGSYNQIIGFEIIENKSYEKDKRFLIRDYEDHTIEFYCESYLIVTN